MEQTWVRPQSMTSTRPGQKPSLVMSASAGLAPVMTIASSPSSHRASKSR